METDFDKGKVDSVLQKEWICCHCTLLNTWASKLCQACDNKRTYENEYIEMCDKKLYEMKGRLIGIKELGKSGMLIHEHALKEYLKASLVLTKDIENWYNNMYINDKDPDVVNQVLDNNYKITCEEFEEQYRNETDKKMDMLKEYIRNSTTSTDYLPSTTDLSKINLNINIPQSVTTEIKEFDMTEMVNLLLEKERFSEKDKRALAVELGILDPENLNLLHDVIQNEKVRDWLKTELKVGKFQYPLQYLLEAIETESVEKAVSYLFQTCLICNNEVPESEIWDTITCDHKFCMECTGEYLEQIILNKYPKNWNCSMCPIEEVDDDSDECLTEDQQKFISTMEKCLLKLRKIPGKEGIEHIYTAFKDKSMNEGLRHCEGFKWCPNDKCMNGFIIYGDHEKAQCPKCNVLLCSLCGRKWTMDHEFVSCKDFELKYLKKKPKAKTIQKFIGIKCPQCQMHYDLAAGGCLHYDCKVCNASFCGGCCTFFVKDCKVEGCILSGFHGHHPRNCLYYLRDYDVTDLATMLRGFEYPSLQNMSNSNKCSFQVTDIHFKNMDCGREVYRSTSFCEEHYKEYLVSFINRYEVDPAEFVSLDKLKLMFSQSHLPEVTKDPEETMGQYCGRLREILKEKCKIYKPVTLEL